MSHVTCHVSHVTCHMSHVACDMSQFFNFYLIFFFGQSGEAYRWRVCYQRGLPHLVIILSILIIVLFSYRLKDTYYLPPNGQAIPQIINKTGVARAVLESPPSFINSLIL